MGGTVGWVLGQKKKEKQRKLFVALGFVSFLLLLGREWLRVGGAQRRRSLSSSGDGG